MDKVELNVQSREVTGSKVKNLRKEGLIPGVVYGRGLESLNIQVPVRDFEKVYAEAGESTLVYVKLGDEELPTIIHDVSLDPVSDKIIHADFYKVRLDEKIKTHIPVVLVGVAPAVKNLGAILVTNINELEVEAFPQDLPHEITVDVSKLENFDDHVSVKDLPISDKVHIEAKPDDIVVLAQEPAEEEAEVAAEASVEDLEVIKKEKPEGEEGEEGGEAGAEEKKE
ncbi:MAG: 50S ribosomal protein L25 [bacterium]|nr:50S ribosomal protein L25 [bacterium]